MFIIFKDCYDYMQQYKAEANQLGSYNEMTRATYAKFQALYSLIEKLELDNEYQDWKIRTFQ